MIVERLCVCVCMCGHTNYRKLPPSQKWRKFSTCVFTKESTFFCRTNLSHWFYEKRYLSFLAPIILFQNWTAFIYTRPWSPSSIVLILRLRFDHNRLPANLIRFHLGYVDFRTVGLFGWIWACAELPIVRVSRDFELVGHSDGFGLLQESGITILARRGMNMQYR